MTLRSIVSGGATPPQTPPVGTASASLRSAIAPLAAGIALLLLPVGASAQPPAQRPPARPPAQQPPAQADADPPAGPAPTVADIPGIVPHLSSANDDEVRAAIDQLNRIDHPSVVPHLATLLRSGRSDGVTDRALEALRTLAHPSSIAVLTEFTRHRRARARRLAYGAIAAIRDPHVPALLEQGLRDSDRTVRANCARALGEINARQSVDTLFVAFDRGVVEAAISIGKLGNRESVGRFNQHLGRAPLSVMLSGYHEYLRRNDIPDAVKVDIVGRLGDVSGPLVRSFLQRYLDTFSTTSSARGRAAARSRVRTVVIDTLRRIPGAANAAQGRVVPAGTAEQAAPAAPAAPAPAPAGGAR